ncbi:hypothetical protein GCM10010185_36720 [Saccharothrix coeruleofusca]|uniref:Uncharacterized protein n=1 Tax=Saccharothrix coeruleofusca TaxID=33919 RepID=A0A918AR66_9PSEU|nr:hypothetical protein GCM10010185_36720 [Saccharothrix coeruleofusca]
MDRLTTVRARKVRYTTRCTETAPGPPPSRFFSHSSPSEHSSSHRPSRSRSGRQPVRGHRGARVVPPPQADAIAVLRPEHEVAEERGDLPDDSDDAPVSRAVPPLVALGEREEHRREVARITAQHPVVGSRPRA